MAGLFHLAACLIAATLVSGHRGAPHHHRGQAAQRRHGHGPTSGLRATEAGAQPALLASALPMSRVTLTPGSRWAVARARNADTLLSMNLTNLLCEYTSAANLTGTFAHPSCRFMDRNGYYGHYLGHWLSSTAMLCNATGAADVCAVGSAVVARLAEVQAAWGAAGGPTAGGYLFPSSYPAFANLLLPPSRNCAPVCVPFYIYHKMMAGMLDQATLTGNAQALAVVLAMGAWAQGAVEAVLAQYGQAQWQRVLDTEWGGMNDVFYNLAAVTGDARWLQAASYFNHWSWSAPLAVGVDDLDGNHANTHLPEVVGDARGYELTGNDTKLAIVTNFLNILRDGHSFATGGSNDGEHWGAAHALGDEMNADTEESCTTYNVIKIARHRFAWTLNASEFDFYERALTNGLIGNQAQSGPYAPDSHTTGYIYMLPLGGGALTKPWGASNTDLPCCWGTLSETFAKLSDSIFWQSPDGDSLFINLFVPSAATAGTLVFTQDSNHPYSINWTTRIIISAAPAGGSGGATPQVLMVRTPLWADPQRSRVQLNGMAWNGIVQPGSYALLTPEGRPFAPGDTFEILWAAALRFEQLDDSRPAWAGVGAFFWGGTMLVAVGAASDRFPLNTSELAAAFTRSPLPPSGDYSDLRFTAVSPACGAVDFMPLQDVVFEKYAAYLHTGSGGSAAVNASIATLPGAASDWVTSGGASITPNGGDQNIRSGDPGQTNTVAFASALQDASHTLTGLSLSYRYVAGYGGDGAPGAATFTIVALAASQCGGSSGAPIATLYTSPELSHYPFDGCNTCYSPPIAVDVRGLAINVSQPVAIAFVFSNNKRNVQLDLPMNASLVWAPVV